jgi:hypothetical protein
MTDREKSSEGFLERWSRKKAEAEHASTAAPTTPDLTAVARPTEPAPPEQSEDSAKASAVTASKPEFDLSSLPSLDTITAATDIRAFLAPGVPKEIARAALRRAWSSDPAIRNFVGLAENAWDFTDPNAMAGFGDLPQGYDVKKLVAQILGESKKPIEPEAVPANSAALESAQTAEEIAAPVDHHSAGGSTPSLPPPALANEQKVASAELENGIVHCGTNTAPQNSNSGNNTEEGKHRRQHGSALPQ